MKLVQPGNEKDRWEKLEEDSFVIDLVLGNKTQYVVGILKIDAFTNLVGISGKGCSFLGKGTQHWSFVGKKLNLQESDAKNFTDFYNTQSSKKGSCVVVEQGEYPKEKTYRSYSEWLTESAKGMTYDNAVYKDSYIGAEIWFQARKELLEQLADKGKLC